MFLKVETCGAKPPYHLSEINLDRVSSKLRPKIVNWLVHLLAKVDIKMDDYDLNRIYPEETFIELQSVYHYEAKSNCILS